MKIWAFTTVRDEQDIIESFVRYNMNICDGMVISDNCSSDNTLQILQSLKKEGYNIDVIIDNNSNFNQTTRRNELLNYTIKKYNPDFILPLDADELICSYTSKNPREIIKKLDPNKLYKYRMENYVLNGEESNEKFIPKRITLLREQREEQPCNYKCFFSRAIYSKGVFLEIGAHSARYLSNEKMQIETNNDLYIAHFPVRSQEQLMNKVIIGRLNNTKLHARSEGLGFHQYEILDEIIRNGTISKKTLIKFSQYYSIVNKEKKITYINKPINTLFCRNINIRYYQEMNRKKILSNTILVAEKIIDELREEKKSIEINSQHKLEKQESELNYYEDELKKVLNSKTWKLKEKIIKIFKVIK